MLEKLLVTIPYAVFIGVGATVIMDVWNGVLKYLFSLPSLNFALVGRWLGHMLRGKVIHDNIKNSSEIKGESLIGWTVHYSVGIIFALGLLLIYGLEWVSHPDLMPALIVGVMTMVFPFLVMQPCFGAGIACSKLPRPATARLKSLLTHMVFGTGLYLSALLLMLLQSI